MTGQRKGPPAALQRSLWAKAARRSGLGLLALLALVAGAVALSFTLVGTDWARERLRRFAEAQLGALFAGTVSVGEVTGSPLSRLRVAGLQLRGPDGEPQIAVGPVEVAWSPSSLLHQQVRVLEVTLDHPVVRGRLLADGTLDLASLLRPVPATAAASAPAVASAWTVVVERVVVRDGALALPAFESTVALGGLQVDGALRVDHGRFDLDASRIAASYGEPGRALAVTGSGRLSIRPGRTLTPLREGGPGAAEKAGSTINLSGLDLRVGASRVRVSQATLESSGALSAALEVEAAAEDAARFAPGAEVAGAVELGGTVTRERDGQPLVAVLHGRALGGQFTGALSFDPSAPAVRGELHGVELVPPVGPKAQASFDLKLDLAGFTAAAAKGTLELGARGVVAGQRVDALRVRASISSGVVVLDGEVRVPGAHAGLRGRARVGNELVIETARLRAEVRDLKLFRALRPGLSGSAALDLTARGALTSLSARGWLRAKDPALAPLRAASLRLGFDVSGLPGAPAGNAQLEVLGAAVGQEPLGTVSAEVNTRGRRSYEVKLKSSGPGATYGGSLSARVTRERAAVRVALGDLAVTARGLAFTGRGGEVLLGRDGELSVRDLALTSAAGGVQASGAVTLPRAGARSRGGRRPGSLPGGLPGGLPESLPEGRLEVRVTGADLARLRAALAPGLEPLAGRIDLVAAVLSQGGALSLKGTATGAGLLLRAGLPPIDAALQLTLGRGRLLAEGHVLEPATRGSAELALDAAVPLDPLDLAAWQRLRLAPLEAVRSARLALHELDLALVAGQDARLAGLEGALDGTAVLAPGTREVKLDLALRALGRPPLRGVDLEVHGRIGEQALQLSGDATFQGVKAVAFEGKAQAGLRALLGQRPLDPLGVPLEVRLGAKAFPLQALGGLLGTGRELTGALDLDAALAGTLRAPHLTGELSVAEARIAGVAFESFVASVKGDAARLDLGLSARQAGPGRLDAETSIDRRDATSSRLHLKATQFDLAFLSALSGGRGSLLAASGGTLDADVSLAPARAGVARSVRGRVRVSNGRFYVPMSGPLDHLELEATVDGGHVVVEKLTGRSGSGALTGSLDADLVGLLPRDFTLRLGLDGVPMLAGARVVKVSTQAALTGGARADGVFAVVATLNDTKIRVPTDQRKGAALQSVHRSKDVVFVDGRGGPAVVAAPQPASEADGHPVPAAGPQVRLELVTPGAVELTGPELDLFLRQRLTITLRDGSPTISGGVETERGFVVLFGARWEVSTGTLSFGPRNALDPRLDLQLSREFRTTTVYVSVTGTVSKPKLSLRANPGSYEQSQILSWVMGGSPDDPSGPSPALGTQAVGVASNFLLGPLQEQLRALLPFDVLAVKLGEGVDTQTTRVQVGKWLSETLFLGYRARLNSPDSTKNQSEANIEWRFARRWFLEAFYGDHGAGGADAIWSVKY